MSKFNSRYVAAAAMLAVPGFALAVQESEPNALTSAQELEITDITVDGVATTGAVVQGVIGVATGSTQKDLDFFTFTGTEGDSVTFDIDGGTKLSGRSVDTVLAVFGPAPTYVMLNFNDDGPRFNSAGVMVDPGSIQVSSDPKISRDSRIPNFRLPATGTYTVGVSGFHHYFVSGGGVDARWASSVGSNGAYTLIISGVSLPVQQISIDIKPGSTEMAPINPKSRGKVPVALIGSAEFSVEDVDTDSLTFGHTGDEESLSKCNTPSDVNGDLFPDMICHFENQAAQFENSDTQAILRGKKGNGLKFEGYGWLKVVGVKAQD